MKYQKYMSIFETEISELALLSTFNFDVDFFEQRLLRSKALAKVRRIVVFMDYGQWQQILKQDIRARCLNQRYLVVPVYRPHGVFHPKLNLLISENNCHISCGSGNLTRSGCTQNLELLNALSFNLDDESKEDLHILARNALNLFTSASRDAKGDSGEIALKWISEIKKAFPWLAGNDSDELGFGESTVNIFHTYGATLWERFEAACNGRPPKRISVISPYYDPNAEMFRRIHKKWPNCKLEVIAQQGTSNLPVSVIKRFSWEPSLFEISNSSRRLHAKLLAWEDEDGISCLAGSANFTSAALDGRNVEACLYLADAKSLFESLFDSKLSTRRVSLTEFEPGAESEPEPPSPVEHLRLESACLSGAHRLQIKYVNCISPSPSHLLVNLFCLGESHARTNKRVSVKENGEAEFSVPESVLADLRGCLLATIVAKTEEGEIESDPAWVIQEDQLTYEPSDGSGGGTKSKIQNSGEGLPEYLEEIGEHGGISAMVEFLNQFNIRFVSDKQSRLSGRNFRLRRSDPFHADIPPEWWEKSVEKSDDLTNAILGFAERHEKTRLRKHAELGNINGIDNFLDIFSTIVGMMYRWFRRKQTGETTFNNDPQVSDKDRVIKRPRLIYQLNNCVKVATSGIDGLNDYSEGYLDSLVAHLRGDMQLLWDVCEETNFAGHVKAALLISQMARFNPEEKYIMRPSDCLSNWSKMMYESFDYAEIEHPSTEKVMAVLEQYKMFSDDELIEYESELSS